MNLSEMWKKLPGVSLFIGFKQPSPNLLEVYATDLTSLWMKQLQKDKFLELIKSCNTNLEMDDAEFFNKGIDILRYAEDIKKSSYNIRNDESIEIMMRKSFGFPVNLTVVCELMCKEMFFQYVTHPLLLTLVDLKTSHQELTHLLLKKDMEIKEYREEGGHIALRHLKTPRFDEASHSRKRSQHSENFPCTEIPTFLEKKAQQVICKTEIKEELKEDQAAPTPSTSSAAPMETASHTDIKQEVPSQSLLNQNRKRPRKLMNL